LRRYLSALRGTVKPAVSTRREEEQPVPSSEISPIAPPPDTADAEVGEGATPVEAGLAAPADAEVAEAGTPVEAGLAAPADAEAAEVATPVAAAPAGPASAPASQAGTDPAGELDPVAAHIADQLSALDTVSRLPLAEHAQLYQHLHAELQDALADIDGS
jgi:hypothetical protein